MFAQENMNVIRTWIEAHNHQGIGGQLSCYDENAQLLVVPTGAIYKGTEVL